MMIFLTETEFISSVLGKNYVTKPAKFSFIHLAFTFLMYQ